MKILIDARLYGPKGAKGLGRYVQQIVEGFKKQDQKNEYIILLQQDNWNEFEESQHFKKVLAPWRWYTLAEQIYLPKLIKKQKPDLVHFPHFNVPFFSRRPFVLTIHDLLLRKYPSRRASTLGPIKYWLKNLAYRLILRSAIKRAKKIIAVSQFTKKEILKYYKIKPERVEVIYNGLTKFKEDLDNQVDKEVILRYNVTKPFLLYVGNAYPHKNLERLLQAFKKLQTEWDGQLVLVGKKDYFYNHLEDYAQQLDLGSGVLFLDYLPDKDLASLYHLATLYVFPSLYEGFGLPALEAMSYGLPVVSSKAECIREICGQAGEYFNPEDIEEIISKIKLVLNNSARQEELKKLGFEQIKKFSWSESVKKHLAIYQQCLEKNQR